MVPNLVGKIICLTPNVGYQDHVQETYINFLDSTYVCLCLIKWLCSMQVFFPFQSKPAFEDYPKTRPIDFLALLLMKPIYSKILYILVQKIDHQEHTKRDNFTWVVIKQCYWSWWKWSKKTNILRCSIIGLWGQYWHKLSEQVRNVTVS